MDLFTLENLVALGMLILLQAVLGFDNYTLYNAGIKTCRR